MSAKDEFHNRTNRREFLRDIAYSVATIATSRSIPPFLIHPDNFLEKPYTPGLIESDIDAPFIDMREGHLPFLKAMGRHPLVQPAVKQTFTKLLQTRGVTGFATAFNIAGDVAQETLINQFPEISSQAKTAETINIAAAVLALIHTNKLVVADYQQLLGDSVVASFPSFEQFLWGEVGLYNRTPPFFGKIDRTWHVANYCYLVEQYLKLLENGGKKSDDMPILFRHMLAIIPDHQKKAKVLSSMLGLGYELKTTVRPLSSLYFWEQEKIINGLLDPEVSNDFHGNSLGTAIGITLHRWSKDGLSWGQIKEKMAILDDPRWQKKNAPTNFPVNFT